MDNNQSSIPNSSDEDVNLGKSDDTKYDPESSIYNHNELTVNDVSLEKSTDSKCDLKSPVYNENDVTVNDLNENKEEITTQDTFSFEANVDITPEKSGGVLKRIVKEGEGDAYPDYGDRVSVHYTGWLLSKNPTVFDTNRKEEKFEFNLGRGMVIKGWDLGVSTMKKGEIALFICNPDYAYGKMGYPPTIPPHTPLLFEIQLYGWRLDDLSPKKDNSILRKVLEKGEGNMFPNEGATVKVKLIKYIGDALEDEKDFILGEGCSCGVPEGIEIALMKFRLNEKSVIYLKNKYLLDIDEVSEEEEVKYEVTLLSFEKVKDIWEMNSDEKFERAQLAKEKGIEFYKAGHCKAALRQFKWIIACLENEPGVSPDSEESRKLLLLSGYLNIALCHLKLENYIDAIKICDKALTIDPKNEKALFRRGQAKVQINDCEEALQDFESLCTINPENKAAQNFVIVCQNNIKKQKLKDKTTYNKMFEIFVKQDEDRLKNMKTETGVWDNNNDDEEEECLSETERIMKDNSAILDANVIELSNTANDNFVR